MVLDVPGCGHTTVDGVIRGVRGLYSEKTHSQSRIGTTTVHMHDPVSVNVTLDLTLRFTCCDRKEQHCICVIK